MQLARKVYDHAGAGGRVDRRVIAAAFRELIAEEDDTVRLYWDGLSAGQQNVLLAIAAGEAQLTGQGAQRRFSLASAPAVKKALGKFEEDGMISRTGRGSYRCDSPFVRGWLILNTLPDLGLFLDPTSLPEDAAPPRS